MTWNLRAPVAFLIFNRPEKTRLVFNEIARARPRKLLIIADGPRADRPGEAEKVQLTRAIVENVDWDCEVLTNYSAVNLGMNGRTISGLNWVFETVGEAIFLEDDCLPHPSFFRYCDELLERYRDDERIMMISGDNFMGDHRVTPYSYFFSHYTGTWGWATWRRAWKYLDVGMDLWPALRDTSLVRDRVGNGSNTAYWRYVLDGVASGSIKSWDFNWLFACWAQNGLSIIPSGNLITNIGFGAEATNLVEVDPVTANLPSVEMAFPLQHPPYVARNGEADEYISRYVFRCGSLANQMRRWSPSMFKWMRARVRRSPVISSDRPRN
jgi:hypothetical protein